MVLEKTLGSPLDCKEEIQPIHSEGDQPWDFFGRNDAKAETPVLWSFYSFMCNTLVTPSFVSLHLMSFPGAQICPYQAPSHVKS